MTMTSAALWPHKRYCDPVDPKYVATYCQDALPPRSRAWCVSMLVRFLSRAYSGPACAVDWTGNYMVTSGVDKRVKVGII